ncbi:hypothetical protein M5D96_012055, partial [Drosophila gunungcola]
QVSSFPKLLDELFDIFPNEAKTRIQIDFQYLYKEKSNKREMRRIQEQGFRVF